MRHPIDGSERRTYYDHESAYRKVLAGGGTGWDDFCHNPAGDSYRDLEAFLSWPGLAELPGRRALELGCGGGQASLLLARRGFAVTGIDFAPSAIALARANAARDGLEVTFLVGDCLALDDFADGSVDLVIDNHVLHCLVEPRDRQRFLGVANRLLAPGGLFFSTTMSCEGSFDPHMLDVDPRTRVSRSRTRYWVAEAELRDELVQARFEVLALERVAEGGPGGDSLVSFSRKPRASEHDPRPT